MLDIEKFYLINVLETCFDDENQVTWDLCNICGEPVASFDVSEVADTYWVTPYKEREENGANAVDELVEDITKQHLLDEHEAEVTVLSMDPENTDLIRKFIGDKVEDKTSV